MKSGLVFVFTHIDFEDDLPVEIIPGHFFRRASTNESSFIRELLSRSAYPVLNRGLAYEHIVKEERRENGASFHRELLPPEKWKYWVIAFNGSNFQIRDLEYAAQLIEHDLDFGFELFFNDENQEGEWAGNSYLPMHLVERYNSPEEANLNAVKVSSFELNQLANNYDKIKSLPKRFSFIDHSIKNFFEIKKLPKRSDLRVVGYFSIIEALITHDPRLNESLDSIGHQVRNKIVLLKKKFSRQISEDTYFLHAKVDKIWQQLYSYRSCVAHGNIPDFKTKFQILKDRENVNRFLKEIIKELLVLAFNEPEFFEDLKNC